MVIKQKTLLLHTCCAHCAAYPIDFYRTREFQVTLFWYNPNIHPFLEHERRLGAVNNFVRIKTLKLIIEPEYEFNKFFKVVTNQGVDRCRECFRLRLTKTAQRAKKDNFTAFSSTLLISPNQKHQCIKEIGEEISEEELTKAMLESFEILSRLILNNLDKGHPFTKEDFDKAVFY